MPEIKRILRVIEYVGDDTFLQSCIERRVIKGTYVPGRKLCYIREAILGDMAELLPPISSPTNATDNVGETHASTS